MLPTINATPRERLFGALALVNAGIAAFVLLWPAPAPQMNALHDLHIIYAKVFTDAKYIDLTHAIHPSMPVWNGFNQPSMGPAVAPTTGIGYTYEDSFIATSVILPTDQLGTQLDPPAHWSEYGATITDLPPTVALRPLVLVDISDKVATDPGYHATVGDVLAWEAVHGRVPAGSAVLFRSDWSRGWDAYGSTAGPAVFPGVGLAALKYLHLNRSILVHGHEPLDTDMTPTLEGEAWLLHSNFMQLEGVSNLHLLPPTGCLLSIGFAKILGGTGGYCRLVAICPRDWPHGLSVRDAPAAPLPMQSAPLRRGPDGVLVPTAGATPTRYCADADGAWKEGCVPPPA